MLAQNVLRDKPDAKRVPIEVDQIFDVASPSQLLATEWLMLSGSQEISGEAPCNDAIARRALLGIATFSRGLPRDVQGEVLAHFRRETPLFKAGQVSPPPCRQDSVHSMSPCLQTLSPLRLRDRHAERVVRRFCRAPNGRLRGLPRLIAEYTPLTVISRTCRSESLCRNKYTPGILIYSSIRVAQVGVSLQVAECILTPSALGAPLWLSGGMLGRCIHFQLGLRIETIVTSCLPTSGGQLPGC